MDLKTLITRYCQYQDRCQSEVRSKLYEYGARKYEVDDLIVELIADGILDEERFAKNYARGKFRIKNWGKRKIIYELKSQQISDYCIRKGLSEINEFEYWETLKKIAIKKWNELEKEPSLWNKKTKLQRYLIQKGFESELINQVIQELI